jgi:immune inhibitor A
MTLLVLFIFGIPPLTPISERPSQVLVEARARLGIDRPEPVTPPILGHKNMLVILIDFPDTPHEHPRDDFQSLLFSGEEGTMSHYYQEVSYGKFSISGYVADWVRVPNKYIYYCNQDSTPNTADDYGFGDYPNNVFGLIKDAIPLVDPMVDFSIYDENKDGYVDVLTVIHAGTGAEFIADDSLRPFYIWSHKCSFSDAHEQDPNIPPYLETADQVKINVYTMQPEEFPDNRIITFGVFAHEYGHILGLPDLYDTDYSSYGVGDFCLMGSGSHLGSPFGSKPSHFLAWCKYFLGWIEPIALERDGVREMKKASIPQVETNSTVYRILSNPGGTKDWAYSSPGQGEYFLIENRQQVGYDEHLPGSGLLILHIDESKTTNAQDNHPLVGVMQADGNSSPSLSNKGEASDLWKEDSFGFCPFSKPSSRFYNGKPTGATVNNISPSGETMTADLKIGVVFLGEVKNYPNPFIKRSEGDYTTFVYFPLNGEEAKGKYPDFWIKIFTLNGDLVRVLQASKDGNIYKREIYWDGKNSQGNEVASGLYYYTIEIPDKKEKDKGKFTFIH